MSASFTVPLLKRFFPLALCLLSAWPACAQGTAPAAPQAASPPLPTVAELTARVNAALPLPARDAQNAPLLAFKMEQALLLMREITRLSNWAPADYLEATQTVLNRADAVRNAAGDAAWNKDTLLQERAYVAANDGSAQPYWVALPPNYNPAKKYPLAIFLHGYTTEVSKLYPWIPPLEVVQAAQKKGFILAIPYGRRNTDFVQVGEDDFLAVRREVERIYSVDPQRVFLTGASMGGFGVWAAGLHTAGQWAALTPICGRTDFYLWFKLEREKVPAWKQLLYDADDPRTLALNMRSLPVYVQHGTKDVVVPVEHSRRIAADAKKFKLPLTYREDPEGDHYSDFQISAYISAFDWMAKVKPFSPPRDITLITGDLKEATAYWASVQALEDYGNKGRLDVSLKDGYRLEVTAANVAKFTLAPPPVILKSGRQLTLKVNGEQVGEGLDPLQPVTWQKPGAPLAKAPAHCGPFKNAFRDPFMLVYGSQADKDAADRFRQEWWGYADGFARIKPAAAVTEEDKKSFNLALFGTRESNPLLGEIADSLPMELTATGYRIGEKKVDGADLGLRMVWKSPWSADRLVVIQSGTWWGERLPYNHKWDLIPDYIIYDATLELADNTNRAVEVGYFDGDWKLPAAKMP